MRSGTAKQLLSWSLVGWTLVLVFFAFYSFATDKGLADALFTALLIGGLLILAVGATGLGVGGMQETGHRASYSPNKKMDQPGARLTSFGAALIVAMQFAAVAWLTTRA